MPHMANLSWMPLFMIFNLTLMGIYFSMKMSSISFKLEMKQSQPLFKKWQW